MLRDARAKISFDLEREGSIVVLCSRGRRMEAVAARYKRRHSSFISVFVLSARARARASTGDPSALGRLGLRSASLRKGDPSVEPGLVAFFFSNQPNVGFMFALRVAL